MTAQRVANLDDLTTEGGYRVEVGGEPLCLVRTGDDSARAVHDICSHQEYSLSEGWVEDGAIECALHGSAFDLETGEPQSLPAVQPIPVYRCEVRDGEVYVDIADQRNDAPVPRHD